MPVVARMRRRIFLGQLERLDFRRRSFGYYVLRTSWSKHRWENPVSNEAFIEKIESYIDTHWKELVLTAEKRCVRYYSDAGSSGEDIEKTREIAETILISRLNELKGIWLSTPELELTLDLFNRRFNTYKNGGIPN